MCAVLMFAACTTNKPEEKPSVVTVNFVDYDGTLLEIVTTKSGNAPVYGGKMPLRPSDETHVYAFVGWQGRDGQTYVDELPAVTANTVFTAAYSSQKRTYTVTFSVLGNLTKVTVTAGEVPVYGGATTIEYDGKTYKIVGWDKPFAATYADTTYSAKLQTEGCEDVTTVNVTFAVESEQLTLAFPTGTSPRFFGTPYKKAAEHSTFMFVGWQGEDGTKYAAGEALPVLGSRDVTYTALFEEVINTYKVRFCDYDGTLLAEVVAGYGSVPVFDGSVARASTEKYDYSFDGWTDGVRTYTTLPQATTNAVYRAVYKATVRKYTLTVNYGNGVASYVDKLYYGDNFYVTSPSVSGKYPDKLYVSGVVTGDVTIYVGYKSTVVWDGSVSESLSCAADGNGAAGSKTNPYLVASGADLAYIAEQSFQKNYGSGVYYKLTADIDLANISWKPICAAKGASWNYFLGDFDGNGHTIYNLKVDTKYKTAGLGLFGGVSGRVANLTVCGQITAQNRLGAVCYVLKGGTIDNVQAYVDITATAASSTGAYVGGLVGMAHSGFAISNSVSYGNVVCATNSNSGSQVGGIVGLVQTGTGANSVKNCSNYGKVSAYRWTGGVVGYVTANATADIAGCANYGIVSATANGVGGVVGFDEKSAIGGKLSDCANFGRVDGGNYVGGVVGWSRSLVTARCTNDGYVSGVTYVGGICGAASDVDVTDCTNRGNVYGKGTSTGGICGKLEVETKSICVRSCANYGDVTNASGSATAAAGGICGSAKATTVDGTLICPAAADCTNYGNVTALNNFVGGVVGANNGGKISACTNGGNVTSRGGVHVGGIAGSNYGYGYVGGCVNGGIVAGRATVGQICGQLTDTSIAEGNTERGLAAKLG